MVRFGETEMESLGELTGSRSNIILPVDPSETKSCLASWGYRWEWIKHSHPPQVSVIRTAQFCPQMALPPCAPVHSYYNCKGKKLRGANRACFMLTPSSPDLPLLTFPAVNLR